MEVWRTSGLYDASKIDAFMAWLHEQIEHEILNTPLRTSTQHWLLAFLGASYAKGVQHSRQAVSKHLAEEFGVPPASVYASAAHLERAQVMFVRAFDSLKGVTQAMEQQISEVLTDGIIKGKGIKRIAYDLNDRVEKVGKVRSRLLARTEIIRSHNVASIQEAQRLQNAIGVEVKMKWLTAQDERVRPVHRTRHDKVYTKQKAMQLIGEPNCRCSVSAWLPEYDED